MTARGLAGWIALASLLVGRSAVAGPPPAVAGSLDRVPALTVWVEVRTGSGRSAQIERRTIARTSDRVQVDLGPGRPSWLFTRNPVDPRRVSAARVDHDQRTIVEYGESDLRAAGVGRSWADVVTLGVSPDALARLRPTGRTRRAHGLDLVEYRRPPGQPGPIREIWWSADAAIPARVVLDGAEPATLRLVRIERGAAADKLADPRVRFPDHVVVDVADGEERGPAHPR